MPRITAPTVVEHRVRQRAQLVRAGLELLAENGAPAVTPAAAGRRVGLARSSVYEYFSSTRELLGAVLEAGFELWAQRVHEAVAAVEDPLGRVDAYVRCTLQLVAEGEHQPLASLARADIDSVSSAGIAASHHSLVAPLQSALDDLGVADPGLVAALLQGLIDAAARLIEGGSAPDLTIAASRSLVDAAVRAVVS